jgi:hypothetical protein
MMPLIPQRDFNRAKKRMQMGLHPAVLEAVQRAEQAPAAPTGGAMVALGSGVNQRPGPTAFGRPAMGSRQGQSFKSYLQQDANGGLKEVHVYGSGANREAVSFKRKLTPELTARVGQSVNQQLSNRATAEDKLLAMAARQAAVDPRLTTGMARRRFSRSPGTLRRI